jgi:D-alanine-D-alanine ligase
MCCGTMKIMAHKTNLILLFGGKSTEHEVSVRSARSVSHALDPKKYTVIPVGITKEGKWIQGKSVAKTLESGNVVEKTIDETTILPDPTVGTLVSLNKKQGITGGEVVNVVFPVLHGSYGEDGTIQGLLELANIPYIGCGVLASALGMDKVKQKEVLRQYGVPVVPYVWFGTHTWKEKKETVLNIINTTFRGIYPLYVKPPNSGSSVGITKAHNEKELIAGIENASLYDTKILIEQGMEGTSEIEVSVLGNYEPKASVCGEILPKAEFYDYDAKYVRNDTDLKIPADLSDELSTKVRNIACDAFMAIDGAGMARVDFFVNKKTGQIWVNELNTIPGFTEISMYPKLWEHSGVSYTELVDTLVSLALETWKEKQTVKRSSLT